VTLEDSYRRLRRLFPARWRHHNEQEFSGTLLDMAEPGGGSISLAGALDLVRCAIVLRSRAWLAKAVTVGRRERVRMAGTVGMVMLAALALVLTIRLWASDVSAGFLLTSLVVAVVPGTGVVYTVSSSIAGGWRRGLFAAIGCTLGIVPHVFAAMLGLSGVMQAGAVAFEAVRWAGVAYLLFMGVSMIRAGGTLQFDDQNAQAASTGAVVRRGIVLNLLNPKLTMFFFAFLPQFLDAPPRLLDARLIGLAGVFMILTLVIFVAYAYASAAIRDHVLRAPSVLRWIRRSLGALVIGFAAKLAFTDR
jgi:threonine/homoserine/homoserine lactone efflux protein